MHLIENWSDIVPSVIKTPISIYQNRLLIHYWYKRLLVAAGQGNTNIVVLGRQTVGKSVLVANLYGEINELSWELPQSSLTTESKAIRLGEWTKLVRVIPGQTSLQQLRGLTEAFNKHKNLEGVIYVTDFGYTNQRDNVIKESMIKERGITTIKQLQKFNLQAELEDFKKICQKITEAHANNQGPKWLAIVVNKADLFFDQINKAQQYYHPQSDSPFTQILKECLLTIGSQNLKCVSMPICSYETDLEWNKEVLKTQIGGTENRRALYKYLVKNLSELSDKL